MICCTIIIAAVYELLKKKSRLFSFGSNNAFLEFFLEGVPGIMQTQMDSKKVYTYVVYKSWLVGVLCKIPMTAVRGVQYNV